MSVHDLAIDVGLVIESDEYETFVATVQNILELGTGYSKRVMEDIIKKCITSELDIAQRVISECRMEKTSPIRSKRLKWWQAYTPRHQRITRNIRIDRTPTRQPPPQKYQRRNKRRPMELEFKRRNESTEQEYSRAVPQWGSRARKRPMSPMFEQRVPEQEYSRAVPRWGSRARKRPMSPMFEQRKRPQSPPYSRNHSRKRRRY